MTTPLGKKLILPTFRLDALVLLKANEAIGHGGPQFIEACRGASLLIVLYTLGMHTGLLITMQSGGIYVLINPF